MRNYLKTKGKELKLTTLGFTLIELLAVIVVLAIIALIATPIVMNTIKNSKKGAAERTADNYVGQVETSLMTYRLEHGENLPNGEYKIISDGNLCKDKTSSCKEQDQIKIKMNGTKPSRGSIVIENGQVKKDRTTMKVGDYDVTYDTTKKTFTASESTGNNVEVLCTANTTKVSALVWDVNNDPGQVSSYNSEEVGLLASEAGNYTPGVTYTCNVGDGERTFYVLEESGNNVSLILGTNVGSYVAWSSDGSNHKDEDESQQAITANAHLEEQTSGWTKLNPSQINLPSAEQIATAVGQIFSQTSISGLPTWLRSYTDTNVAYGYWTSTPHASFSSLAWYVDFGGHLSSDDVDYGDSSGVRPVITISKTQLG